jgi:hypothetical protein
MSSKPSRIEWKKIRGGKRRKQKKRENKKKDKGNKKCKTKFYHR